MDPPQPDDASANDPSNSDEEMPDAEQQGATTNEAHKRPHRHANPVPNLPAGFSRGVLSVGRRVEEGQRDSIPKPSVPVVHTECEFNDTDENALVAKPFRPTTLNLSQTKIARNYAIEHGYVSPTTGGTRPTRPGAHDNAPLTHAHGTQGQRKEGRRHRRQSLSSYQPYPTRH